MQVQDAAGEPYDPPANPVVTLRTDGLDLGTVVVRPIAAGTYRGEVVVPRAGEWEVQVGLELQPLRQPGHDGHADCRTVSSTGTVCRKPSTRTCANRR